MAKGRPSTVFFCSECGYESSKWMGQCPACKAWNTLVEEPVGRTAQSGRGTSRIQAQPTSVTAVSLESFRRYNTGMTELDRVLGGGIVPGSLVLVGGDPGIGKSTLLLQVCRNLASDGRKVMYISGEESLSQIKMRAMRIGEFSDNLLLLCETNLADIEEVIKKHKPDVVIIDSIQTMYSDSVSSAPGSVSQVREATNILMGIAKRDQITVFIVGHVTKEGTVAGPRVLEHMVDTVLYFEGDRYASYRIVRAAKNRFGSTNEIGVFEMRSQGLVEVANPSEYMLSGRPKDTSGSCVVCAMEGTRPMLVEVQALVCRSGFGIPRRQATGIDFNRVNLLMAVLEKRMGLKMGECDAYLNVAGGMKMNE
ncbi:MAG: DNA repair protein RadA, partial [Lachnospiraceae bacterium]|nr:DNA repair protein RadA [Lachnospiraceae bacterium]